MEQSDKNLRATSKLNIAVLGAGYVGLTTATLLANCGYKVYLVEPNEQRLKVIRSGKSFFYEDGLDALVARVIKSKLLVPTDSYQDSVSNSMVIFSCVGTPDNSDGSSNLEYVFKATKQSAQYLKDGAIYAQKSTVPVGTGEEVIKLLPSHAEYVSNPEFLKEGSAINDSLFFDRIVVGGNSKASDKVLSLYKSIEENREEIAKIANLQVKDTQGEYIKTSLNSAELIKVSANAFLALKISFANSIAKLADKTGADIQEVMEAVGADKRIGKAFLNAGRGYGGGCFPKDVSGLIKRAEENGVSMEIMSSAVKVNDTMADYIVDQMKDILGSLTDVRVAVLGLAFKAGTSDVRRSPAIKLTKLLADGGAEVSAYDPKANDEAKSELNSSIRLCDSKDQAVKEAQAVLVATDWQEFIDMDLGPIAQSTNNALFVDCMNRFDPNIVRKSGLRYLGVGKS